MEKPGSQIILIAMVPVIKRRSIPVKMNVTVKPSNWEKTRFAGLPSQTYQTSQYRK